MNYRVRALFACVCIAAVSTSGFGSETTDYSYDARGRLKQVNRSGTINNGVSSTYGYDAADNRSSVSVSGGGLTADPAFFAGDASVSESGTLSFTVTRTGATSAAQSVTYATASHTATSGTDFTAAGGTLNFAIGETSKPVSVTTAQDQVYEGSESLVLNLSNATNGAAIGDPQGVGTIIDDDVQISFAIADTSITEGSPLVFTVTKTGSTSASYTVDYGTGNGSAHTNDYTAATGTLTFGSSETSKTVSVTTTNDSTQETSETVLLNLSNPSNLSVIADGVGIGTINDNDAPPPQYLAVSNGSAFEGSPVTFTVTRTGGSFGTVTVNYATATGTAGSSDFTATSGTLTFTSGQTSKNVNVATLAGGGPEATEQFYLNLSNASGATISDAQGVGYIEEEEPEEPCPNCLLEGPPPESSATEEDSGGML